MEVLQTVQTMVVEGAEFPSCEFERIVRREKRFGPAMVDSCAPLPGTKPVHSSRVVGERKEGTKVARLSSTLDFRKNRGTTATLTDLPRSSIPREMKRCKKREKKGEVDADFSLSQAVFAHFFQFSNPNKRGKSPLSDPRIDGIGRDIKRNLAS